MRKFNIGDKVHFVKNNTMVLGVVKELPTDDNPVYGIMEAHLAEGIDVTPIHNIHKWKAVDVNEDYNIKELSREYPTVITLSGRAGSGKDTAANTLTKMLTLEGKRVFQIAYADAVKIACARNFGYDDVNKSAQRNILQTFGTDVVRAKDRHFWVRQAFNYIHLLQDDYDYFIITDARYTNELGTDIERAHFNIVNVFIDGGNEPHPWADHSSEDLGRQYNPDLFDFRVDNTRKDMIQLVYQMDRLMRFIACGNGGAV